MDTGTKKRMYDLDGSAASDSDGTFGPVHWHGKLWERVIPQFISQGLRRAIHAQIGEDE